MRLTPAEAGEIIEALKFKGGLLTAVVRDFKSGEILMVAFQNREAVMKTLTSGVMYYWSRSRRRLWLKGEVSGHHQRLRGVKVDCDGDALLYDVEQVGAACHEGYFSCFYRDVTKAGLKVRVKRKFKPEEAYG
jgi:phosphoribosyl-AMP cyclohydrolase